MDNGQTAFSVRLGPQRVTWPISPCKFFIHQEQMGATLGKEVLNPPRDIWKCLEAFEKNFFLKTENQLSMCNGQVTGCETSCNACDIEKLSLQRFQHTVIQKYCFKALKTKPRTFIVCLSRHNQKGYGAHLALQHTTSKIITLNQMMTSVQ